MGGEKKNPCALVGVGRVVVEIGWAVFCLTLFARLPSWRAPLGGVWWIVVDGPTYCRSHEN